MLPVVTYSLVTQLLSKEPCVESESRQALLNAAEYWSTGILAILFLHYANVQCHANPVLMHALGMFEQHGSFILDKSDLQKTRLGVSMWF
jgi:hypothetical protein